MNYDEVTSYLLNIPKFSKKTSMENLAEILKRLGNPQEQVKSIHVAGTNGKGSVCAFLNTMLVKSKKQVGMFTSPHLVKMNERMRMNGEMVSDEEFVRIFQKVKDKVEEMQQEGFVHPSFFEFLFLMAALLFTEHQLEYGIFEVGLGGRLDATNILRKPEVSVITSLSLDHTEILGNTIEQIAAEKGGIIKEGVPVVFYQSSEQAAEVIAKIAEKKRAPLIILKDEDIKLNEISSKQVDFSLNNRYYNCGSVTVNFPAAYQAVNCSLALVAYQILKEKDREPGYIDSPEAFVQLTRWEGRMEQVRKNVFLDGAHNLSGIREFQKAAENIGCAGRKLLLFSVVGEKDYEHMIPLLLKDEVWDEVFIARMDNQRAVPEERIAEVFKKNSTVPISIFPNVKKAVRQALDVKNEEDILFCAGSLYLIGELKEYLEV